MDAIILAGGAIPEELRESLDTATRQSASDERALLPVGGRPAIAWIMDSLRNVSAIDRVIVVGEKKTLELLPQWMPDAVGLQAQNTLSANVLAGLDAARSESVLVMTCDIPLVTSETWEAFLEQSGARGLEAAYPIVRSGQMESTFPGGKRTYATVTDGKFTGGNAFLLPKSCRGQLEKVLETAYNARKNPLKLAALLGPGFIFKAALRRLSIADAGRKISRILRCEAGAIEMQDAAIAFDMDKASDYQAIQSAFTKRGKIGERD